jgi:hypothetical protein
MSTPFDELWDALPIGGEQPKKKLGKLGLDLGPRDIKADIEGFRNAGRAVIQGRTLGAGDEIVGAVRGALPGGPTISEAIDEERAGLDSLPKGGRLITELGGGFKTAFQLAKAPGRLKALANPVVEGAFTGAASAEGGVKERGFGAGIGAMLGKAGDVTVRAVSGAVRPAVSRASGELLDMKAKAGASLQGIAQRLGKGKPSTLADEIGDEGLRKLRSARAISPVAGQQIDNALATRRAGQEERILSDLLETTGIGGRTNTSKASRAMIAERAEGSRPLYRAAHSLEVRDDRIDKFLKIPQFQQAYLRAQRLARLEGDELPEIFETKPGMHGPRIVGVKKGLSVPVKALDYLKRGVDEIADPSVPGTEMGRGEARAVRGKLNEMLDVVDELVPEFAEARAYYKGESDLIEALEQGRKLFQMHPDEAAEILANPKLTDGERELLRKGMMESVADRVENVASRADVTKRKPLDDSTMDRKRLRLLFDDDASFEAFKDRLAEEVKLAKGEDMIRGGSNTADKLMDIAEMAGVDVGDVLNMASGNFSGVLQKALNNRVGRGLQSRTRAKADALTPMLLADTPDKLKNVGRKLVQEETRQKNVRQLGSGVGRALATGGVTFGRNRRER